MGYVACLGQIPEETAHVFTKSGAIPAKTGSWDTGGGLRQTYMVRRELLIATSTFFTCGLLLQTGTVFSCWEYQGLRGDP